MSSILQSQANQVHSRILAAEDEHEQMRLDSTQERTCCADSLVQEQNIRTSPIVNASDVKATVATYVPTIRMGGLSNGKTENSKSDTIPIPCNLCLFGHPDSSGWLLGLRTLHLFILGRQESLVKVISWMHFPMHSGIHLMLKRRGAFPASIVQWYVRNRVRTYCCDPDARHVCPIRGDNMVKSLQTYSKTARNADSMFVWRQPTNMKIMGFGD